MPVTMTLIPKSENIAAVGYDAPAREMHVKFHSGATYVHAGVAPEQHADFLAADSKGRHYAAKFRANPSHPHRKLEA